MLHAIIQFAWSADSCCAKDLKSTAECATPPLIRAREGRKKDKEREEIEMQRLRVKAGGESKSVEEEDGWTERGKVKANLNENKQLCPSCSM